MKRIKKEIFEIGRIANEKHVRSLKRLNISKRSDRMNKLNQIRKSKLETTKQSRNVIGAIDGVPQIIVKTKFFYLIFLFHIFNYFSLDSHFIIIRCQFIFYC